MQLENIIGIDGNNIKILVDQIQHISIARNFLLITVSGSCFLFNKLSDAGVRCDDSLKIYHNLREKQAD